MGKAARQFYAQTVNRNKQKRARLIQQSIPLVKRIAANYRPGGGKDPGGAFRVLSGADLEQEGMIGLIRAVDTFDPTRGTFKAWVEEKVRGAILDAIRGQGRSIRLPNEANAEYLAYRSAVEDLTQHYGTTPTAEDIASEMGVAAERVHKIAAYAPELLSIETGGEDGEPLTAAENVPEVEEDERSPEDAAWRILDALGYRESALIDSSGGITGDRSTYERIARITGLAERQVKTGLQRIRRKLRKDPRVLELKKAKGYVTAAERAERLRRIPAAPTHGCRFPDSSTRPHRTR